MRSFALVATLSVALAACGHGNPPAPPGVDATVAPLPGASAAPLTTPAASGVSGRIPPADAADGASAASAASVAANAADASVDAAPTSGLDAGDPGSLPQTRDRPSASSDALTARAKTLWDAIAHDDPELAIPFFFPVHAYEQVKAIAFPAADWRRRLVAAYTRDIHALAKGLGSNAAKATFVRLEIPDARARWVEPNEESNKLGYFRVYGAHLVYVVEGKERAFDLSSLISWRGEWYCVHLTGFK